MNSERINRMPEAEALKDEHRAIAMLRILQREPSSTMNDELLRDILRLYGFRDGRDDVQAALDRLERAALIVKIDGAPSVVIVQLTERGERVALGEVVAEGVALANPWTPY